jgi:hypothetical protein
MRTKRLHKEHKAHGGRVKGSQAWSHRQFMLGNMASRYTKRDVPGFDMFISPKPHLTTELKWPGPPSHWRVDFMVTAHDST